MIHIEYVWPWQTRTVWRWFLHGWKFRYTVGVCVLGLVIEFEDYRFV